MKRSVIIPLFILALFFSCTSPAPKADTDKRTVFRYNEMSGISSLDPAAARSFENIWAVNQLFNGLVQMDDQLNVKPCIARSWEISEDGMVYTFHLRTDVKFHDNEVFTGGKGRKVIAEDFLHSFFRLFDAKISSATTLMTNIDRGDRSGYKGFEAPNDSTFVIYLVQPFKPFLGILTMKYFSVVPEEVVEHYGDDFRRHPVGTGPFMFKYWEEGSKLVFVKNPDYFEMEGNEQLPHLDAISVTFIKDKETAFLEFIKGNLDMVSGMDAINKDEVLNKNGEISERYKGRFNMQSMPFLKTDYLGILIDESYRHVKEGPLRKKEIRQAINYGFDRVKMVKYLRNGLGTAATSGFVPPGLPMFDTKKIKGYTYDPDKVKELLFLAGYPEGKGLPVITLYTTEQYNDLCEFMQAQLAEVNIKVKISIEKSAVISENVACGKFDFFRKSWVGDYPDAENFLSLFYSKNFSPAGFNYTHYNNKQFDVLYERSREERNDSLRHSYYEQMDQLIMDEAPIIPLYYDQVVRLIHKNVDGLSPNPMNLLDLRRVKKAPPAEK